jgi:hypothetical protein
MPDDPNQINVSVVLSGQHATSVKPLSSDQNVGITVSGQKSNVTHIGEHETTVHMHGIQGPPGPTAGTGGPDGSVQYNEHGVGGGAETFFYQSDTDKVLISGGSLVVNEGDFIISGDPLSSPNTFAIKDDSKNVMYVDSQNKKIVLSQNTGPTEYFIGVGTDQPQEKFHLQGGNLRVDGDVVVSGNVVPEQASQFSLGSPTKPWKDLYLDGDSIIFEDKDSKISVEQGRFSFFSKDDQGVQEEMFFAQKLGDTTLISGVTIADAVISGKLVGETEAPYSGLVDAGEFISQSIPSSSSQVFLAFGHNLSYTPKVVCTLVVPQGQEEMYYFVIKNVTTAGADIVFSDEITSNGYSIDCFVSPKMP